MDVFVITIERNINWDVHLSTAGLVNASSFFDISHKTTYQG